MKKLLATIFILILGIGFGFYFYQNKQKTSAPLPAYFDPKDIMNVDSIIKTSDRPGTWVIKSGETDLPKVTAYINRLNKNGLPYVDDNLQGDIILEKHRNAEYEVLLQYRVKLPVNSLVVTVTRLK